MNYWLIKSEPNTYSWDDLVSKGSDLWDGVRNYTARNNLKEMKIGDLALFYHSVKEKAIVGIAECTKEHYPDPSSDDDRWVAVDFKAKEKLKKPITLEDVKADERLSQMELLRLSRLSVQSVSKAAFDIIISKSMAK
jgi:predicted RNA-binding protein with PUA-like domain